MKLRTMTMGLVVWTAAAMGLAATAGADSSAIATVLDMSFDGELTTTRGWGLESQIKDQLLYTIGSLNASNSVGRLDKVVLTNVQRTSLGRGRYRVTYHAQLPVAWGSKTNLPTAYTFTLPRDVSSAGLEAFTTKYKTILRRLRRARRRLGQHVVLLPAPRLGLLARRGRHRAVTASVAVSPVNTTGKFPEYNKVWEDDALQRRRHLRQVRGRRDHRRRRRHRAPTTSSSAR